MSSVRFDIRFPRPETHLVDVELVFEATQDNPRLWFAAWTPGSYLIREYARNKRHGEASVNGEPAALRKLSKDEWAVEAPRGARVCVRYAIYAHELTVRTAHHDATHAFLHPAQIYLLPEGHAGDFVVTCSLPEGWDCTVMAPRACIQRDAARPRRVSITFADIDALLDAPLEVGIQQHFELPHPARATSLVVWGDTFPRALLPDLAKTCAAVEGFWPTRPFDDYTFVLHHAVGARGGLEHCHGSVLGFDPDALAAEFTSQDTEADARPGEATLDFLELACHELFHAWNGKRLRPKELGPFDYRKENYTRLLWVVEGLTSYYEALLLVRAGIMTPRQYCARLAKSIVRLQSIPGRLVQSAADASFDAWIKLYRPQDDSNNASVSYYLKGALIGLSIDLWLRAANPESAGMDDVLHRLWELGSGSTGYTEHDVVAVLEAVGGRTLPMEVRALWEQPVELDFSELANVGLRLQRKSPNARLVDLGMRMRANDGSLWVTEVATQSEAERAGVAPGDELLAVENHDGRVVRLRAATPERAWNHVRPGQPGALVIARRDRVMTLPVRFSAAQGELTVEQDPDASAEARRAFERWSGQPWTRWDPSSGAGA